MPTLNLLFQALSLVINKPIKCLVKAHQPAEHKLAR